MKQTKDQFVGISYDELLTENAKLRELGSEVAGILFNLVEADYCGLCGQGQHQPSMPCPHD